MEMKILRNIGKILSNQYGWYDDDMKKFPRFRKRNTKICNNINEEFPRQLTAKYE